MGYQTPAPTPREPSPSAFGELSDSQRDLEEKHERLMESQQQLKEGQEHLSLRLDEQATVIADNTTAIAAMQKVVEGLGGAMRDNTDITAQAAKTVNQIKGDTEGLIKLIRDAQGAGRFAAFVTKAVTHVAIPVSAIYAAWQWLLPLIPKWPK